MALAEIFSRALGRNPTQAESSYMNQLLSYGDFSEFDVEQLLGGLPAAQKKLL